MKLRGLLGVAALGPPAWVFLKIGMMFFGGGFLLIPIIHGEVVVRLHWLTQSEFVDGVALSQLTPGPVAVLATFCGFRQAGPAGALVATAAVFLPAFLLMLVLSHAYGRLKDLQSVQAVLGFLVPAIVGLLLASAIQIGQTEARSIAGMLLFAGALAAMIRWNVRPALLIAGGAVLGLLFHM